VGEQAAKNRQENLVGIGSKERGESTAEPTLPQQNPTRAHGLDKDEIAVIAPKKGGAESIEASGGGKRRDALRGMLTRVREHVSTLHKGGGSIAQRLGRGTYLS